MINLSSMNFEKGGGLVVMVAQDAISGAVLMVAFADRAALERTIETRELHLFSRTRGPWRKGATSGNVLQVESLAADCDGDAVLARVRPIGPACHTGNRSCFGDAALAAETLAALDRVIAARAVTRARGAVAAESYTAKLLADRNLRLKKIGEEAAELVTACADGDRERATAEAADLLYHALVALRAVGAGWDDVRAALAARFSA